MVLQHHRQAKRWKQRSFPLFDRLEYIFGKDRATGKSAYTPENLAADMDMEDVSEHEVECVGNFSPLSASRDESSQPMTQPPSQTSSRKRSRSGDSIVRSMETFSNVLKDTIKGTMDRFCQVLQESKVTQNRGYAQELIKMQIPNTDALRVMQKFREQPDIGELFMAQPDEEAKMQFIASILSGAFGD